MKRKIFIKKALGAVLIGVPLVSYIACSKDDSANGDPDLDSGERDCISNGANAISISSNHGHTLTVSKEDIDAGVAKTYSIQGSSGHDHVVGLTEDNFASLKANGQIVVESTTGSSHRHDVTVACA
ncbi:MAG: hypothetical protein ABJN84_16215 [Flavobacteriaceae bacterium]